MRTQLTLYFILLISTCAFAQFEKRFFPVDTTHSDYDPESGVFIRYQKSGSKEIKGKIRYGVLHDSCTFFYENGNMHQQGLYYYGTPIGTWSEYTKKGDRLAKMFTDRPDESKKPKEPEVSIETTKEYILRYPNSWIIIAKDTRGFDFFLFPWDAFGPFKDNMNIGKMPIEEKFKTLDSFREFLKELIALRMPTLTILHEREARIDELDAKDIIGAISTPNGLNVTTWTRYFVTREYAYQITLTCETSQFERRSVDFEKMLNQFEIR